MLKTTKMFTTTHEYCVTPTKHRPMMRLPERATAFMRDVKRRSLRVKRSKSLVINPPEKRKSGRTSHSTNTKNLIIYVWDPKKEQFSYSDHRVVCYSDRSSSLTMA